MNNDIQTLRELAFAYRALANDDCNAENFRLHRAVNDLKMIRPVILFFKFKA